MENSGKKVVAVLFGGRAVEHEISVISALQMIEAMDRERFTPLPVYITHDGRWFAGNALLNRDFYKKLPGSLAEVEEVTLLPKPGVGGLTVVPGSEHSVLGSLFRSRSTVLPVDVFFPVFHGDFGEDGCIQGVLEMADVPYVGPGVAASGVSMNKQLSKLVVGASGVPVLPGVVVLRAEIRNAPQEVVKRCVQTPFPLFVKPVHLGSSVGVGRAKNEQELLAALVEAAKFDTHILVEPCISELMEINVSVLDGEALTPSVVEIPVSSSGVLTYEEKYMREGGGKKTGGASQGMASLTRVIDPEELAPEIKAQVTEYALRAFAAIGCSGVARLDFIHNLADGKVYFNEINPIPGSLSFYLWAKSHPPITYTKLIARLVERAVEVKSARTGVVRDTGFRALLRG